MARSADNSAVTPKKRIVGKPFVKGDPRINRNGAPRIGLSWKEILDEIGGLDGAQALERAGRIFSQLKKYPNGVSLKELAAISYYIRMINDPNGSLLTAVADRTEGKVKDQLDITSNGETVNLPIDDERYNRTISTLADAVREGLSGQDNKADGKVDTSE